jgi:uncharacterized RDD family membrane protein YckC
MKWDGRSRSWGCLIVRTAEGIVFAHRLGGPIARFLSLLIDFVVVGVGTCLLSMAIAPLMILNNDVAAGVHIVVGMVLGYAYWVVCEGAFRGQTLGKRMLRLRVLDAEGLPLCWSQVLIRNLLRAVDMLPAFYLVGGAAMLLSRRCQRLGDLAAGTIVVSEAKPVVPPFDRLERPRYNTLRDHPRHAMRLRQTITPEEAALAVRMLVRRDTFEDQARLACFSAMSAHMRARVELPEDALVGISDEQFVRNVVDIVYTAM